MKKILLVSRVVLLMMVFTTYSFVFAADKQRTITVTGDAQVNVVPDQVLISLGIETWDKDMGLAKSKNDQIMKKILGVASSKRINSKDIQTDFMSIEPRYQYEYERQEFLGYFVRQSIVITLSDIDMFEDVLSKFIQVGSVHLHGVQFRTSELKKYREEARLIAITAAKEKAMLMAEKLDQRLGQPYHVNEVKSGWLSSYNNWWGRNSNGFLSQNVSSSILSSESSQGGVALGEIAVNAQIIVSFELL